jgi:hypothetical protein
MCPVTLRYPSPKPPLRLVRSRLAVCRHHLCPHSQSVTRQLLKASPGDSSSTLQQERTLVLVFVPSFRNWKPSTKIHTHSGTRSDPKKKSLNLVNLSRSQRHGLPASSDQASVANEAPMLGERKRPVPGELEAGVVSIGRQWNQSACFYGEVMSRICRLSIRHKRPTDAQGERSGANNRFEKLS